MFLEHQIPFEQDAIFVSRWNYTDILNTFAFEQGATQEMLITQFLNTHRWRGSHRSRFAAAFLSSCLKVKFLLMKPQRKGLCFALRGTLACSSLWLLMFPSPSCYLRLLLISTWWHVAETTKSLTFLTWLLLRLVCLRRDISFPLRMRACSGEGWWMWRWRTRDVF